MEKFEKEMFEAVNNDQRQKAIRRKYSDQRRRNNVKILRAAAIAGAMSMFFGLIGICGGMVGWIAYPVFSISGILSAFMTGRWFENGKCLGWR